MISEIKISKNTIDERASIHPTAKIAENVAIGPWTIIGPYVEIGEGTEIAGHVVIKKHTKIGRNNKIYQFASLGEDPLHLGYKGEETWLQIGDNNIIREFATLNRGTIAGGGKTIVGDHNLIMCYVHIGHDCQIGNHTVFVNNASLSGHVHVGDYAMLGVFVGVHQHCHIGAYSFISQAAMITQDVLPYLLVVKPEACVTGLNVIGLKRRGFNEEIIRELKAAYDIIFRQSLTVKDAITKLEVIATQCQAVQLFIDSMQNSKRGITR